MKIGIIRKPGIFLALTALAGCYAQIEDTDVSLIQTNICGQPSNCPGGGAQLNAAANFVPPLTLNLGESGVLTSAESKQGPITFNGSLLLNKTIITMKGAGDFSGVRTVDLRAVLNGDSCAALSASCKSIGTYDFTRDGQAGSTLVLKGSSLNLLDVTGPSKKLLMVVKTTGNAPSPRTWQADAELNMTLRARGSFP